jgi:hypothetical protein
MSKLSESCSLDEARSVMGKNILVPEQIFDCFPITSLDKHVTELKAVPFSASVLDTVRETHVLVPGQSVSIVEMRSCHPVLFDSVCGWCEATEFATVERVKSIWYLFRKHRLTRSYWKSLNEQTAIVPGVERMPRACELVYKVICTFLCTGTRLHGSEMVRTSDVLSPVAGVCVGFFKPTPGLKILPSSIFDRGPFLAGTSLTPG